MPGPGEWLPAALDRSPRRTPRPQQASPAFDSMLARANTCLRDGVKLPWLIMLRTSRAALFGAIFLSSSLAYVFGVSQTPALPDIVGVVLDGNVPVPGARVSITQNGTSA